jgi:hypothetical protein
MKKKLLALATALVTVFSIPTFGIGAWKNISGIEYTDSQLQEIVNYYKCEVNDFMPDRWFAETTNLIFYNYLVIETQNGYVPTLEDFKDNPAIISVEERYLRKDAKAYEILFETYDDAINNYQYLQNLEFVRYVGSDTSFPDIVKLVNREDVPKYLTPEEIQENAEKICEVLHLTQAELFELGGITQADPTLSGDIDGNGKVQLNDVVLLSQAISAENIDDVLDSQGKANADVFADGIIDSADLSVFSSAMVNSQLGDLPKIPE